MNKIFTIAFLVVLPIVLNAQKIQGTTLSLKSAKELKKAVGIMDGGYYWSKDGLNLYKLTVFTPKKSTEEMLQIHTINETGKVISTELKPFTEEVLRDYAIQPATFEQEQAKKQLEGFQTAYIKNTLLAGKPDLVYGSFEDRYHSSGVWIGFKFKKKEKVELDEKFWSFVSFPVQDEIISKNYHLLAPPGNLGKLLTGFGYRQYLNADKKAYIGGLMATAGQNEFLSGVYDLTNREWINKTVIDLGMEILPGQNSYERLENGNTAIILASKDQYKCLVVDALGNKVSLNDLGTVKSGGGINVQISPVLKRLEENKVAVATSSYQTLGGKEIGLGLRVIENDKVVNSWNYSNEDLIAALKLPAKHKVKAQKLKYFTLESLRYLEDGSFIVNGFATQDKINSSGRAQILVHISSNGQLKNCFMMESLTPANEEQLGEKILTSLLETKDGFYWVERSEVKGHEKGVYSYTDDFGSYTRTTTFRHETTMTRGQISKVNLNEGTISNSINPKGFILGDEIGAVSSGGTLVISTDEGLVFISE